MTPQPMDLADAGLMREAELTQGGLLYLPAGGAPRPAIILLHGWQPPGTNGAAVLEGRAARLHGW